MTDMDPAAAEAVRTALGLQPGDPAPADLAHAAAVVNAAAGATRLDGGSVVLLAARLAGQVHAEPGGPTCEAARRALAAAWPVTSHRDLADLAAVLLVFCATWATDADIAQAARIGAELP
jgi:alkylhydroperoxidase family enzyme